MEGALGEGLASGTLSGIQRKRIDWAGKALSPDRILGVVRMTKESLVLSSDSRVISAGRYKKAESSGGQALNFLEELRVDDGADCTTVRRMAEEGAFLQESPF